VRQTSLPAGHQVEQSLFGVFCSALARQVTWQIRL
jgi:hypothetical protein